MQKLEGEEGNAFSHLLRDTEKPKEWWLVLVSVRTAKEENKFHKDPEGH